MGALSSSGTGAGPPAARTPMRYAASPAKECIGALGSRYPPAVRPGPLLCSALTALSLAACGGGAKDDPADQKKAADAPVFRAHPDQRLSQATSTVALEAGTPTAFVLADKMVVGDAELTTTDGAAPDGLGDALEKQRGEAKRLSLAVDVGVRYGLVDEVLAAATEAGFSNVDLVVDGGTAIPIPLSTGPAPDARFVVYASLVAFHHECVVDEGATVRGRMAMKRDGTPGERAAYHLDKLGDRARECLDGAPENSSALVSAMPDLPFDVVVGTLDAVAGPGCKPRPGGGGEGECLFPDRRLERTRSPEPPPAPPTAPDGATPPPDGALPTPAPTPDQKK